MTREERENAIDIIQSILDKYEENECLVTEITIGDEDIKAFKMAREALKQQSEDAISREDALMCMTGEYVADMTYKPEDIISKHIKRIRALPSVQPKAGHWISMYTGKQSHIKNGMTVGSVKCSECDEWLTASNEYACNGNYCPNCGARMVESQESEE